MDSTQYLAKIIDAPRRIKDDGVDNGDDGEKGCDEKEEEKNKETEEEEEGGSEVFAGKVGGEEERGNNESRRKNERPLSEGREKRLSEETKVGDLFPLIFCLVIFGHWPRSPQGPSWGLYESSDKTCTLRIVSIFNLSSL